MDPSDFIATAKDLVSNDASGRPRETNLRRAVSTTYYALFHCLAESSADMLVGGQSASRSEPAWHQVYRALNHGTVRKQCEHRDIRKFPQATQTFAVLLSDMQRKRHYADYDPGTYHAKRQQIRKSEVLQDILAAERAMDRFVKSKPKDRRAFAVFVLLNVRTN